MGMNPFEDEGGISGISVLSTSHVSIHTWPLRSHAVLDVYSCREYDARIVVKLIKQFFQATGIHLHELSFSLQKTKESLID